MSKYLTWLRRDWHFTTDARHVLRFMSTQINIVGASLVGFQIYAGWPAWTILLTLVSWVALAALGAVIEQPELED